MGQHEDRAARSEQARAMVRKAVALGLGEEAKRVADKYQIPNIERIELGVEVSSDPQFNKIPKAG